MFNRHILARFEVKERDLTEEEISEQSSEGGEGVITELLGKDRCTGWKAHV